jgi:uncharacterized alpha-E superfamily protein
MLSRAADAIYWMNRYVERAENIARFIQVNLHLSLDQPMQMRTDQWAPLVKVTGDYERFVAGNGEATQESVIDFLTFNRDYPNSIISCLDRARENARSVRQIISSEMWQQINTFYLMVAGEHKGIALEVPDDFFARVQMACHTFTGIMSATMSHGEAWHFGRIGAMLERADKTSRILDVKYFILLPQVQDVGTPYDNIQWSALLKSASAFEMYRKRYGRIEPRDVAAFLILDPEFPRSIHYCLLEVERSLHLITGTPSNTFGNEAERSIGRLRSGLVYTDIGEIIDQGLHQFLDGLQAQLNAVNGAVSQSFFPINPTVST